MANIQEKFSRYSVFLVIVFALSATSVVNSASAPRSGYLVSSGSSGSVFQSLTMGRRPCNLFARKSCLCPMTFKPICGSDKITYANLCQFHCTQKCEPFLEFVKCGSCWQTSVNSRACLNT